MHLNRNPALVAAVLLLLAASLILAASGSLSGVLKDASSAVISGATLTLVNLGTKAEFTTTSDARGVYSFPALPVGKYELTIESTGFKTQKKTNIGIDTDSAVALDVQLAVGEQNESVTVSATEANVQTQPDTVATHLGEVVSEQQVQAIPLNGRSYTDLLAIQPGVTPVTTSDPNLHHHGGRHRDHQSIGRPESRQHFHRWTARIVQRIHGEFDRRAGSI